MKCVILAGGKGNRMKIENGSTPKPLITIGDKPILWHIMKIYYYYGINEFIICVGYQQEKFKEFFVNSMNYEKDIEIDYSNGSIRNLTSNKEKWKVIIANTGEEALTGGRLKQIEKYLEDDEEFLLTYADAVADIDINELIAFHKNNHKKVTISVVKKNERFGIIKTKNDGTIEFREKEMKNDEWINAGFMVINKDVFSLLKEDSNTFEKEILEKYAKNNELSIFKHNGFWQCMDYYTERDYLNQLIKDHKDVWKKW